MKVSAADTRLCSAARPAFWLEPNWWWRRCCNRRTSFFGWTKLPMLPGGLMPPRAACLIRYGTACRRNLTGRRRKWGTVVSRPD